MEDFSQICYRHSVTRRIPRRIRLIQGMLYFSVAVFTFLGTMWGFPMLVLTLGTLFGTWYFMGLMRVEYEYRLDDTRFTVIRHSGMRSRPKAEDFLKLELGDIEAVGYPDSEELEEIEERTAHLKPRRIMYNVSAHDVNRDCAVAYVRGIEEEKGRWLKVYFEPEPELMGYIRKRCPGKVFVYEGGE
ncbi:MAG: hypothetical protein Q4F18_00525 [Clostridia bacterium]|nr:hypothetical protein [Clostridia bacterium]